MGFKQNLLASASQDQFTASFDSRLNSSLLEPNQLVGSNTANNQSSGIVKKILSTPLNDSIIPTKNTAINVGAVNTPIENVFVKNLYVRKDGLKFYHHEASNDSKKLQEKASFNFDIPSNNLSLDLQQQDKVFSSGSITIPTASVADEYIDISFVSSSAGYMDIRQLQTRYRINTTLLSYEFKGASVVDNLYPSKFALTPSGALYNTGSTTSELSENLLLAFNNFASGSVSQSVFPFSASLSGSNTLILTTTISGSNKIANISNYISSSQHNSFGGVEFDVVSSSIDNGVIDTTKATGSFTSIRRIHGGKDPVVTGSFQIKQKDNNNGTEKNLLKISSSEDIVQFGEETSENRFWKFKKDGRIVYSPSNSSDTFELNVSQSLEFAKRENFGTGTKTSFTKTKGDTDETKRVTDVTNIRLPYNKGITLVSKDGIDTIGGFGITTTDLSSSRGDSNVENVIRFKGAGGFSFQNAIGLSYFHIDNVGNAAFGNTGIVGDHWGASANFHVTGSKLANIFRVSTDTDVINIKDNKVTLSGSLEVSGSITGNTITMTNHAYYDNTPNERNWVPFTPFGTQETNMWTSSRDNTHRFIAPHNGQLKRVMIINNYVSASEAHMGETKIAMTVFPQLTGSEEASKIVSYNTGCDFDFSQSIFNKGDLLGVYIQPTGSARYVNVTCVWEYDTRT